MTRTLTAFLLAAASFSAAANDFYVVVPLKGRTAPNSLISVALASSNLPSATVGKAYTYDFNQNLQVTGDAGFSGYGVTWSVVSGSLPPGLTLNTGSGLVSGTPTTSGTSAFVLSAAYKTKTGEQSFQIPVSLAVSVTLSAGTPPQGIVGNAYSYNLSTLLSVTGDNAYTGSGVTWSVVSNTLPTGLYLTSDGYIGGTPTSSGSGTIAVRAAYKGASGEQTFYVATLNIVVSLATASLPSAMAGDAYSYDFKQLLSVTGDTAYSSSGVTWEIASGSLPPGISLTKDGVLSGTPVAAGTTTFTLRASYLNKSGQRSYQVVTSALTVALTTATVPSATVGKSYTYDFKPLLSVIGDATYLMSDVTWAIAGSLPPGLTFNADGTITGTPTAAIGGTVTVTATYKTKGGSRAYALSAVASIDMAALTNGVKIGTSAPGVGSTTDSYFGPSGYTLSMNASAPSWSPLGAFYSDAATLNTIARPAKNANYGSTFVGKGSAAAPFNIVLDLGQIRTFNSARYYQMFSDGKTTHAALDVSSTGNLEVRTSANWTEVQSYATLDNSATSNGIEATFAPVTARYLRIRLYNSGAYGSLNYTELYGFKLFNN